MEEILAVKSYKTKDTNTHMHIHLHVHVHTTAYSMIPFFWNPRKKKEICGSRVSLWGALLILLQKSNDESENVFKNCDFK